MDSSQTAAASGSVATLPEVMGYGRVPSDPQSMASMITGRRSPYHPSLANVPGGVAASHAQAPQARGGRGSASRGMRFRQMPQGSSETSPLDPRYSEVSLSPFVNTRRRRAPDPLGMSPSDSVLLTATSPPCNGRRQASLKPGDDPSLPPVAPSSRRRKRKAAEMKPPPNAKDPPKKLVKQEQEENTETENANDNCCICMCEPEAKEKAFINGCEHIFCFGCIEKWADRENTCPLCKARFSKIERVIKPPRKKGVRNAKNTKKVKNKDQRSEISQGNPLQGLFASLEGARFVFSGVGFGSGAFMELNAPGFAPSRRMFTYRDEPPMTASAPGAAAAASRRVASAESHMEDVFFSSDDEGNSDDEEGFGSFVQRMRTRNSVLDSLRFRVNNLNQDVARLHAEDVARLHAVPMVRPFQPPPRSYASNMDDADAGTENNALEIESDSDDEEIEVVHVAPARGDA